ncbi:hypothetical protein PPACK8108_LOCUS19491 [Phakopsora pachyrhizi]|uniref:Uncharacterized protein n=1 Tax=Phakopsora pachyrhizi TaxID=170000 RepID=A0AAV0BDY8_PHAPC|nr:hypothetical protein PPACK8108_LOCUS19491 [Phakopsora pachyrhizi]
MEGHIGRTNSGEDKKLQDKVDELDDWRNNLMFEGCLQVNAAKSEYSQPVNHPPGEEDIQMNLPEQNPILQQPIVPPQRNNDDPQGIHKTNRAQDNPDPDEQNNPANGKSAGGPKRNSHGQLLDQVNRAVAARSIPPASSGLARSISAFAKFVIPSPPTPEEHDKFENHKNEIHGAISQYVNNSLDAARQMYGAID